MAVLLRGAQYNMIDRTHNVGAIGFSSPSTAFMEWSIVQCFRHEDKPYTGLHDNPKPYETMCLVRMKMIEEEEISIVRFGRITFEHQDYPEREQEACRSCSFQSTQIAKV